VIPLVVPPLKGAGVLVTRPTLQAGSLIAHIQRLGGEAVLFPAIAIEPIVLSVAASYDLVIFVSANAVEHGARLLSRSDSTRIAAIGKATAAALSAIDVQVDFVPAADSSSEALLAHPDLAVGADTRVLIVRGVGGRTLLQESFAARGSHVDVLEVYRRTLPTVEPAILATLATRWDAGDIDIVTLTSIETLTNLLALLGDTAERFLRRTPLLVASQRIGDAAVAMGLAGEIVLANGADDESLVGALCFWRTRARSFIAAQGAQATAC
jgi:uroporphyrinogen-III synthase